MKPWRRRFQAVCAMALFLAAGSVGFATEAKVVKSVDDIVQAHPAKAKPLFENDHVWVLEFNLEPGEGLPTHGSGNRAVYALSNYELLFVHSYEPLRLNWRKGEAHWHHYEPHAVRNVGKTHARYIVVSRKNSALPRASGAATVKDLVEVAPDRAKLLLQNTHARVADVTLRPGERLLPHSGSSRVIYSLTSYKIRMGTVEKAFREGDVHWHDPGTHLVENVGDTIARYVVFELKR